MCTRSNCKPGGFNPCFDEGIVGMTGAPLGKSLVAVTLNKKLSAASGNSIYAGGSELNETGVTPKGRRFQNALPIKLRRPVARGRVQASATYLTDSSTHWTIAWSSFDRPGSFLTKCGNAMTAFSLAARSAAIPSISFCRCRISLLRAAILRGMFIAGK
jgi:hypothetical protein